MNGAGIGLALVTLALWSCTSCILLALVGFPPTLVMALSFLVAGLVGVAHLRSWKVPLRTFLFCTSCFVGYRLLVMASFEVAPRHETNLINGLNSLLIVVLTPAVLAGYRIRPHHLVGCLLGFLGAAIAVTGGHVDLDWRYLPGYGMAMASAVMWALYSLLLKRLPPFPSMALGGFLTAAGVACLLIHLATARWHAPTPPMTAGVWLAIIFLGIGPTGIAYVTWDAAMKRGDPRVIGAIMYLAPLTSTLAITLVNGQRPSWSIAVAAIMMVAGAVVGSWSMIRAALGGAPGDRPAAANGAQAEGAPTGSPAPPPRAPGYLPAAPARPSIR